MSKSCLDWRARLRRLTLLIWVVGCLPPWGLLYDAVVVPWLLLLDGLVEPAAVVLLLP